ncbi:hypothetical protein NEMBOFW57_001852 [Staphylotrichum longicolle]|uniref:Uncharacterized protein n=1 Tax=Staphylotrichum longicolle TaxID=669026 RepID=A0AAD4F2E9_9PEZI|nr:hypothetical protein NEMBOFW57_001852 [Staphylotrichum longicolle]
MLCGIHPPSSHHHHHGFLRSFRSHRALRQHDDSNTDSFTSQEAMHHHHHHHRQRPSDASSPGRPSFASSSRPSTSSSRAEGSIDWDPLRMNPPSLAPGLAPPLQETVFEEDSRLYQPHELRHAARRASSNPIPSSRGAPHLPRPAPTPDASSECSISFGSISDASHATPEEMGLCAGLAPAPAPRPRPRPRPRFENGPGSSGGLDADAQEYLRRGGWKRRGIVFVDVEVELGEDEAFEI